MASHLLGGVHVDHVHVEKGVGLDQLLHDRLDLLARPTPRGSKVEEDNVLAAKRGLSLVEGFRVVSGILEAFLVKKKWRTALIRGGDEGTCLP